MRVTRLVRRYSKDVRYQHLPLLDYLREHLALTADQPGRIEGHRNWRAVIRWIDPTAHDALRNVMRERGY